MYKNFLFFIIIILIYLFYKNRPEKIKVKRVKLNKISDFYKYIEMGVPVILTPSSVTIPSESSNLKLTDNDILKKIGPNKMIKVESSDTKVFSPNDPNSKAKRGKMSVKEFILNYKNKNLYWAEGNLPKELNIEDPKIGKCLEALNLELEKRYIFMGYNGNITRTHRDDVYNLINLYRGKKKVKLFNPKDKKYLYLKDDVYSDVNLENINYFKHPKIIFATEYIANLKAGEILYIPHEWFHHVKSLDNNLAVSYWYSNSSIKDSKNVPKLARKVINSLE